MAVVLICSRRSLDRDLASTFLFRTGLKRETVVSTTEAQARLTAGGVSLLCIQREVSGIESLITTVRRSPALKSLSIVILSEDDFDPSEVELLEAGANAILRLPPGDDFDERVARLIEVPSRRDVRIPVRLQVAATSGFGVVVPVLGRNLSASGILIESNHALNIGDEVTLDFRFEESGELFSTHAYVTRTAGPNRYGVRFTNITRGAEALKTFLGTTSLA